MAKKTTDYVDRIPSGDGTLDLGASGTSWKELFVQAIDMDTTASAITTETLSEYITIKIGGVSKKIAIVA